MAVKDDLKALLSDVVVFYFRAQGFHWNVEGADFREYHGLFEEIYSDVYASIDPIAENIRKLDDYAPYRLDRFLELKTLEDSPVDTSASAMAKDLLAANEVLIRKLNGCFKAATDEGEEGIANFLAERIDAHQKWSWFLKASTK